MFLKMIETCQNKQMNYFMKYVQWCFSRSPLRYSPWNLLMWLRQGGEPGLYFLPTNHLPLVSLQEKKYSSILPLCSSLSLWPICPSVCALPLHCSLILLHRLATSCSGPVHTSVCHFLPPSPPSPLRPFIFYLPQLLRASYLPPSQKCWQTCFWNGFSLWKTPPAAQQFRVKGQKSPVVRWMTHFW